MSGFFGGGVKKAAQEARAQAAVSNDRALAELRAQDARSGASRRNPRGRRLFTQDASQKKDLS